MPSCFSSIKENFSLRAINGTSESSPNARDCSRERWSRAEKHRERKAVAHVAAAAAFFFLFRWSASILASPCELSRSAFYVLSRAHAIRKNVLRSSRTLSTTTREKKTEAGKEEKTTRKHEKDWRNVFFFFFFVCCMVVFFFLVTSFAMNESKIGTKAHVRRRE